MPYYREMAIAIMIKKIVFLFTGDNLLKNYNHFTDTGSWLLRLSQFDKSAIAEVNCYQ